MRSQEKLVVLENIGKIPREWDWGESSGREKQ